MTMDGRARRVTTPYYREWRGKVPVEVRFEGTDYEILPGDFVLYDLVRPLDPKQRRALGPPLKATQIQRRTGVKPDHGQLLVRTGTVHAVGGGRRTINGARPLRRQKTESPIETPIAGFRMGSEGRPLAEAFLPVLDVPPQVRDSVELLGGWAIEAGVGWVVVTDEETDRSHGWLAREFDLGGRWAPHQGPLGPDLYRVTPEGLESRQSVEALPLRATVAELINGGAPEGPVLLADEEIVITDAGLERLAEALPPGGAIFPLHNVADPASLPMVGQAGSALPRLAGGADVFSVDRCLRAYRGGVVDARPANPGAVLLSPELVEKLRKSEHLDLSDVPTCLEVFAWRPGETRGAVAEVCETGGGHAPNWPTATSSLRDIVRVAKPAGLPVALYTHAIGPWGGVGVLIRLAAELANLGASAVVAYHNYAQHNFRSFSSPRVTHNPEALVNDPASAFGWQRPEGVVIGSHWYSGIALSKLVLRYPGIVPTTILQDREDWFRNRQNTGPQLTEAQFRDYLAVGEGVAVAPWIIESLTEDFPGFNPEGYRVIPAGIDCDVFRPGPRMAEEDFSGPIRVLSMGRPGTAIRRGYARLRTLYGELKKRYPSKKVRLELFGWKDKTGLHRDPPHHVHHGPLAPEKVAELMREVDIVVEPSDYQGFGLPGLEAMRSGACLVSTACRGVDAYAEHEENALIVPHDDLLDGVVRAIEDHDLRRKLRAAGPDAAAFCSWERVGAQWGLYLGKLVRETHLVDQFAGALAVVEERATAILEG